MKMTAGIVMILLLTVALCFAQGTLPLRVDHVPICVAELGKVQQAFAAAGLTPDYGGPHSTGGTHMALLGFDDEYPFFWMFAVMVEMVGGWMLEFGSK